MKFLSESKALERLRKLISNFKSEISANYDHRAKSCVTCEVQGSCCLDAHFVNVNISRLEAVNINQILNNLPESKRFAVNRRIGEAIKNYGLSDEGETYSQTYACPLFEKGAGCLVHDDGKPAACIAHACYESAADLPPGQVLEAVENRIDALNERAYGWSDVWQPIPLALERHR